MADLKSTNYVIVAAPLPADFDGSPQRLFEAFVQRLKIMSPLGSTSFIIGDVAPATNQGPWLKDGTQWYVWDEETAGYIPQKLTDATLSLFIVSEEEPEAPGDGDATIWLRVTGGRVVAWYFWNGSVWRPSGNRPASGTTEERPSDPADLEQYWDTTINCLIHWERGSWRTVSGVPGDVKFVTSTILDDAVTANPGWEYIGESNQSWIGRTIGIAAKDPGATPDSSFATDSGITARAAQEVVGEETHVLTSAEMVQHTHIIGCLTSLVDNNFNLYRVDNGEVLVAPTPLAPNYASILGDNANDAPQNGELPAAIAGGQLITSKQLSKTAAPDANYTQDADGHNNLQPTLYLWALTKL